MKHASRSRRRTRSRLAIAGIGLVAAALLMTPAADAAGSKGGAPPTTAPPTTAARSATTATTAPRATTPTTTAAAPSQTATSSSGALRPSATASTTGVGIASGSKAPSSRLAETDPSLLNRTDATVVPVMIKLDYDSTATYAGGVDGLAATSPAVTGRPLTGTSGPERAYEAHVANEERSIVAAIDRAVPAASFSGSLRRVYGGVVAQVPANQVSAVLAVPGVVAVQRNALNQPLTDSSADFINAPPVYTALGGTANAGAGIIYGNLDTGLWPEHPSFADLGNLAAPPGPARECNYGDNPLTAAPDVFACQHKLIGGAAFTDTYDAIFGDDPYAGTARDGEGHGTHTASTTAGNGVNDVSALGRPLPSIHGIAPGAWVMEYKVCGPQGCQSSDSAAAVEQAIVDGVDVINFSISGGTNPFSDPVELAFLDAYAAGVFVSTSAGNDGPGAGTVNHLSPWVTSVAASTQTREFATTLHLTATGGATFDADGASITAGVSPAAPVVLASTIPDYDAGCSTLLPPGSLAGKILACQRGGTARAWKGFVAHEAGAVGMILYNATLADNETDNHWVPTVHLADGTAFVAFMNSHTGVQGSWAQGAARNGQGDVMAAFSSRGPGGLFVKPDITAPGVQILAGNTPTPAEPTTENGAGPPGNYFQAIAGTSMSSPHIAGAAILVRAMHPDWTPGQIQSALMTSSITNVLKEDHATPADPFDMGAGRVNVGASVGVPFTISDTAANMAVLASDPVTAPNVNIPSINAPVMPGRLVTTRTLTSTGVGAKVMFATATAPPGSSITISPSRFSLPAAGGTVTLTITITSNAPVGQQQFGTIRIAPAGGTAQHLPVAFVHTQGSVSLTQACSPTSIVMRTELSQCTITAQNNAFNPQALSFRTTATSPLRLVSTSAGTLSGGAAVVNGVNLTAAAPGVPSVEGGGLFGYLALEDFGATFHAVDDETILNFNLDGATIPYNGAQYSTIGIDSNGYVIMGGGTSEDNECCNLPAGPSAIRPNNILAPFWTDLDGSSANGVALTFLGDETDEWLVVEWQVKVFGTNDLRTFQLWLGDSSAFDDDDAQDISFAYAAPMASPNGQPFLYGAENQLGQGDMVATLPAEDQVVTSTAPTPGGSFSYSVNVRGDNVGTGTVTTAMTASGVPGVTTVSDQIRVVRPGGK